jgi:hypothetical protein
VAGRDHAEELRVGAKDGEAVKEGVVRDGGEQEDHAGDHGAARGEAPLLGRGCAAPAREEGERPGGAAVPVQLHREEEEQAEPRLKDAIDEHDEKVALVVACDPRERRERVLHWDGRQGKTSWPQEAQQREERARRPHPPKWTVATLHGQP